MQDIQQDPAGQFAETPRDDTPTTAGTAKDSADGDEPTTSDETAEPEEEVQYVRPPPVGTPINTLPNELVMEVLKNLEAEDICAARLVRRQFYDLAWPMFGEVISNVLFDLKSVESWKNLEAISMHVQLTKYIKSLRFCAGTYTYRVPAASSNQCIEEEYWQLECRPTIEDDVCAYFDLWTNQPWYQFARGCEAIDDLALIISRIRTGKANLPFTFVALQAPRDRREGKGLENWVKNPLWGVIGGLEKHRIHDERALCVILAAMKRNSLDTPLPLPWSNLKPRIIGRDYNWMAEAWIEETSYDKFLDWELIWDMGRQVYH